MKSKRLFFRLSGFLFLALLAGLACGEKVTTKNQDLLDNAEISATASRCSNLITLFMAGDVMIG